MSSEDPTYQFFVHSFVPWLEDTFSRAWRALVDIMRDHVVEVDVGEQSVRRVLLILMVVFMVVFVIVVMSFIVTVRIHDEWL